MVASQQIAVQPLSDKGLRSYKHLRLGAAKAVNALLGIAHNKDTRRTTGATITAEPGIQGLPLQRIGVLKLVDQQVPDAGIETLLHPTRQHRVAEHVQSGTLDIIHVYPAALMLERLEFGQQQPGEAGQTLLIGPGLVLGMRLTKQLQLKRRLLRGGKGLQVVGQAVFAGDEKPLAQARQPVCQADAFQRGADGQRCFLRGFVFLDSQASAQGAPFFTTGLAVKRLFGAFQTGQLWHQLAEVLHRVLDHPCGICQRKFSALVERALQGLVGLRAAMRQHDCFKVRLQCRPRHQNSVKPTPD